MRHIFVIAGLLFLSFQALAQTTPVIPRISFLVPKVGAEIGIHSVWSFYPALGMNFQYTYQSVSFTNGTSITHSHLSAIAVLDLQGRHYYNVYKRVKQNKDVDKFSANFLCLRVKPGFVLNPDQQYISISPAGYAYYTTQYRRAFWGSVSWGLQRNIGTYGYYSFMLGPGISIDTYTNEWQFDFLGGTALEIGLKF